MWLSEESRRTCLARVSGTIDKAVSRKLASLLAIILHFSREFVRAEGRSSLGFLSPNRFFRKGANVTSELRSLSAVGSASSGKLRGAWLGNREIGRL